jgi:hypothetical protein
MEFETTCQPTVAACQCRSALGLLLVVAPTRRSYTVAWSNLSVAFFLSLFSLSRTTVHDHHYVSSAAVTPTSRPSRAHAGDEVYSPHPPQARYPPRPFFFYFHLSKGLLPPVIVASLASSLPHRTSARPRSKTDARSSLAPPHEHVLPKNLVILLEFHFPHRG